MIDASSRCGAIAPHVLLITTLFGRRLPPTSIEDKAKICATCHGEKGIPTRKTIPVIWGQNEGYLYLQLRDFKSGARKNDLMSPIAAGIDQPMTFNASRRPLHQA